MKAMAYYVTNLLSSINKNKSVVQGKELRYDHPAFAFLPSSAQPQLKLQLSWAELVLFSSSPTSHPPTRESLFLSLILLFLL